MESGKPPVIRYGLSWWLLANNLVRSTTHWKFQATLEL